MQLIENVRAVQLPRWLLPAYAARCPQPHGLARHGLRRGANVLQ